MVEGGGGGGGPLVPPPHRISIPLSNGIPLATPIPYPYGPSGLPPAAAAQDKSDVAAAGRLAARNLAQLKYLKSDVVVLDHPELEFFQHTGIHHKNAKIKSVAQLNLRLNEVHQDPEQLQVSPPPCPPLPLPVSPKPPPAARR